MQALPVAVPVVGYWVVRDWISSVVRLVYFKISSIGILSSRRFLAISIALFVPPFNSALNIPLL